MWGTRNTRADRQVVETHAAEEPTGVSFLREWAPCRSISIAQRTLVPFGTVAPMVAKVSHLDRFVPWLGGLALAVPVVATRYPPMTDLPLHEGMVALLRHHGDPAWAPPGLYALDLGHANQLFYLLAYPLSFVFATDVTCKLLVAAILVLTLGAAGRLASHLGRSPWVALTLAPVVLGWTFFWGFVANMLGFALFLLALPMVDRIEARSARGALLACAMGALVFFAHEASALALSCAVVVIALSERFDRRTLVRLAPVAMIAALSAVEVVRERAIETPLMKLFGQKVLWHPLATKLSTFPRLLTGAHGLWTDLTLLAPAAALAVLGTVVRARAPGPEPRARRYALLAAALRLFYLAAPYSVNFGAFLYVRFLAPAFAVAVVAAAPSRPPVVAKLAAALVLLGTIFVVLPQFAAASEDQRQLVALFARMEPASAVDVLHVGKRDKTLLFEATGGGNRVLAERGGRLAFSFAEYPIAPVAIPPDYQWNDTLLRLYADPTSLRPALDFDRFRYALVQAGDPGLATLVERAMAADARRVAVSGEWTLFESTHPVVPLTAKDAPLPLDPPPTLQELAHALARASAPTSAPAPASALSVASAPPAFPVGSAQAALSSPAAPTRVVAGVYLLVSSRPDPALDSAARLLSASLDAFVPERFGRMPALPVTVFLFSQHAAYEAFCRAHYSSVRPSPAAPSETATCLDSLGVYFHQRREIVVDAARGPTTLTHEVAHTLLEGDFPAAPLWFDEGLASLYEWPDFPRPGEIHGKSNFRHQRLLDALGSPGERESVRLDALFGMSDPSFPGLPETGRARQAAESLHYAMARETCRWLDAQGQLWPLYKAWRDGVSVDPTGEAAFARVVGKTPKEANADWLAWVTDQKNDDRTPGRVP
jgi:hypothetical protein